MRSIISNLLAILLLISCNSNNKQTVHIGDTIINQLESQYGIAQNDTLGDGRLFYSWNIENEPYKNELQIKGMIDRTLNVLPVKSEENLFSQFNKCLYNFYEWETPLIDIVSQHDFRTSYSDTNKTVLYVRIWMLKK
ncbi:MAG: hypothetical protein KA096_01360 [Bacteroidales bacterium]|nr:hypothetical protein [Bacteroidales bacterium]